MSSDASTCDADAPTSREQTRRLHFCNDVAMPIMEASSPVSAVPCVRSAIKSPTRRTASARRLTGTGETLHVHVNPCPNVVEVGAEDSEIANAHEKGSTGQVANELAAIGAQGNGYHSFLYDLADLLLRRRPESPEQCIVDHLYSRQLPTTLAVPNGRVFEAATDTAGLATTAAEATRPPVVVATTSDTVPRADTTTKTTAAATASSTADTPDTAASRRRTEPPPVVDATPSVGKSASHVSLSDPACGASVAERLTCGLVGCPAGRNVALRYAKLLLHRKPDDPEDFLWTRLEGRSFGDDAAVTNALSSTADATPNFSASDPTQAALLKDMPLNTPGYNVAAAVVALLFTRKPDNVVSFLFYHYSGRVHSSAAASARSSSRRRGVQLSSGSEADARWRVAGDVSDDSRTSRELVDEDEASEEDSTGVAAEHEAAVTMTSTEGFGGRTRMGAKQDAVGPDERRGQGMKGGALGSGDDGSECHSRDGSSTSSAVSENGSDSSSSSSRSSGALVSYVTTSLPRGGSFGSFGDSLQFSRRHKKAHKARGKTQQLVLPTPKHGAAPRTLHSVPAQPTPDADSGRATGPRHVTITTATTPRVATPLYEPATVAPMTIALQGTLAQQDSLRNLALIRHEYELLRLREEHRRWRLQHEVEILRQECAFREHLTRYDHSEQALSTAHAAEEMLREAEHYLRFLDTQAERLQADMQRVFSPTAPASSSAPVLIEPSMPGSSLLPSYDETYVPSELDILKKRVELLSMEQERARALAQQQRVTTPHARRASYHGGRRVTIN